MNLLTDHLRISKARYEQFLVMIQQWRHLRMLKRVGRGFDLGGVGSMLPGALALLCPACPHPGLNMASDWSDIPKDKQFVLTSDLLTLSFTDLNFLLSVSYSICF